MATPTNKFLSLAKLAFLLSFFLSLCSNIYHTTFSSSMARNTTFWSPENIDSHDVHVLAVDDSLIDRKVIERLLKITSCKGTQSFFWFLLYFYNVKFFYENNLSWLKIYVHLNSLFCWWFSVKILQLLPLIVEEELYNF